MQDFTLYPEALALKELGFNEPCIASYTQSMRFNICEQNGLHWETVTNDGYIKEYPKACTAPTFSQAFRFFRKQHKLNHSIETGSDAMKYATLLYESRPQIAYIYTSHEKIYMGEYAEYEEAELACLKELIKIVKNKKP